MDKPARCFIHSFKAGGSTWSLMGNPREVNRISKFCLLVEFDVDAVAAKQEARGCEETEAEEKTTPGMSRLLSLKPQWWWRCMKPSGMKAWVDFSDNCNSPWATWIWPVWASCTQTFFQWILQSLLMIHGWLNPTDAGISEADCIQSNSTGFLDQLCISVRWIQNLHLSTTQWLTLRWLF